MILLQRYGGNVSRCCKKGKVINFTQDLLKVFMWKKVKKKQKNCLKAQ